jgi:hypothetical protein
MQSLLWWRELLLVTISRWRVGHIACSGACPAAVARWPRRPLAQGPAHAATLPRRAWSPVLRKPTSPCWPRWPIVLATVGPGWVEVVLYPPFLPWDRRRVPYRRSSLKRPVRPAAVPVAAACLSWATQEPPHPPRPNSTVILSPPPIIIRPTSSPPTTTPTLTPWPLPPRPVCPRATSTRWWCGAPPWALPS